VRERVEGGRPIERRAGREGLLLAAAALVCLLPFADKPFHIDDPVYVWVAEQIARAPADFYGFELQWYGSPAPVYAFNKNPPLSSFYLAGAGVLFGFGERAMHGAMALVAVLALLGVHALARALRAPPLLAALLALAAPGLLVSATSVMSDLLLLVLWVWALALWVSGLERRSPARLIAAALLAGLAPLAKYFGLALLPLLALVALARERRVGPWATALALPVAMVAAYELYMRARYGWAPLADVGGYALGFQKTAERFGPGERLWVGLAFFGGALLPQALCAPWLWSSRALAALAGVALALFGLGAALPAIGDFPLRDESGAPRIGYLVQLALFASAGVHLLALALAEALRTRDATSLLLLAWVGGVFVFAAFTNWVPNVRAVLPAAPAAAVLVAQRLAARAGPWRSALIVPIALSVALGLVAAQADRAHAESARQAAHSLAQRYGGGPARLFFQGTWGFQYYMQAEGIPKLDPASTQLGAGDRVIAPANNSNVIFFPESRARTIAVERFPSGALASVHSKPAGAGFYAALWGPLPFVLGEAAHERYLIYEMR
jgi:4-amino-4-deoxy-L-arabinose transferase-like glycosyltransferase